MALRKVRIGSLEVSRLIIGGNQFSGFSHQSTDRDKAMRQYYSTERIKEALHKAEDAGINTFVGRADAHVMRLMEEYWTEGGKIQWIAQTAPEIADLKKNITAAASVGAKGCYLHGGQVDFLYHNKQTDQYAVAVDMIRARGMTAGLAGHLTAPHEWVRDNLPLDFQLTSYYNPMPRTQRADHIAGSTEVYDPADRDAMAEVIKTLRVPAIHYKVMAAGRTAPEQALQYVARILRPQDAVLIGFYLGDDQDMIAKTVAMFERIVENAVKA